MPLYLLPQKTGSFTLVSEGNSFILQPHKDGNFILGQPNTGATGDKGDKGDTGVVTATLPLVYNEEARSLSIQSGFYLTVSDAADIYQPISAMGAYLTISSAASTYYPLSNPTGFITSSALTPYLLSSTASATYYPITNPTGFITASALTGYATEAWVGSQGYLTSASLAGYATESWVTSQGYLTSASLSGYATESWVLGKNYITSAALSPYLLSTTAASTYYPLTNPSGYITTSALAGYATESWVTGLGYITSSALAPYLTISSASATYQPLSEMSAYYLASNPAGYITSAALGGYATESWVNSQGFLTAPYNPFDQSLNTTDFVTFNRVDAGTLTAIGGDTQIAINSGEIIFPDNTEQTTAAVFYDQSLNTADSPTFASIVATDGTHTSGLYPESVVFEDSDVLTKTTLTLSDGVNQLALGTTGIYAENGSGSVTFISPTGITFPDSTTQDTAAVFYDQSLNTGDSVQFLIADSVLGSKKVRVDAQGVIGEYGVFITNGEDGTSVKYTNAGITFADGTTQTTAATTPDLTPYAEKAVTNTFSAGQVIEVTDNANAALRVTQLGSGDAFRVEDSENPDSTPFVITADGRVGINSDFSPSYFLQVGGNSLVNGLCRVSSGTGSGGLWVTTTAALAPTAIFQNSTSTTVDCVRITNLGTGNSLVVEDSTNPDSSPFVITADGNVGIGRQPTAGYKLDVAGQFVVAAGNTSTTFASGGTTITAASTAVGLTINNTGTGNSFRVNDESSDTTPFIVDAGGNVGVKTATPAYDLDVNGTANLTTLRFADGTTQTTAATGNAFDQDLNTFNNVVFNQVVAGTQPPVSAPQGVVLNARGIYLTVSGIGITFPSGNKQYKEYPFSGAIADAIEGGLLNANSPSSTNAFATLGDVESSVNAYAASVTPVLPTADEKAALSNANLPSASNPYLTLTGAPLASESNAGIVELASKSEVLVPTSTTLAVSPAQAVTLATRLGLKRNIVSLQGGMSTQITGTGAAYTQVATYVNATTPNSGIAGFARGYTIANTADPAHISSNGAWVNFSKPEGFGIGIYLSNATAYSGVRVMGIWGETNSPTAGVVIGDPTNKRVGFSHTAGGNILLMVHNGTTLTYVDSGMTPPLSGTRKYYIEVTFDGTGYAEMYVKDALGAESTVSTTAAPVGAPQSLTHSTFMLQASATGAQTSNYNNSPTHPTFFFG